MPQELITQFYHYGMIDYIEFHLRPTTEEIINTFGEKFTLVAGNIATHALSQRVGCKFFASFPEANNHTYRPARKRIFLSNKLKDQALLEMAIKIEEHIDFTSLSWLHEQNTDTIIDFHEGFIKKYQQTPNLPDYFPWYDYKLMAEGHYIQLWTRKNWDMLLPFMGEGDKLEQHHINNTEDTPWPHPDDDIKQDSQSDVDTIPTIDSNYRDF